MFRYFYQQYLLLFTMVPRNIWNSTQNERNGTLEHTYLVNDLIYGTEEVHDASYDKRLVVVVISTEYYIC